MADKVKILVIGDSGSGKTSMVHKLCHKNVLTNPRWTVGCNVDVKMHTYNKNARQFFLEFWDVGGHRKYKHSRHIFYNQINGIIITFDVTNKEIANFFKVQYQTTLLIFKGNKEVYRSIGETTKELIYDALKSSI